MHNLKHILYVIKRSDYIVRQFLSEIIKGFLLVNILILRPSKDPITGSRIIRFFWFLCSNLFGILVFDLIPCDHYCCLMYVIGLSFLINHARSFGLLFKNNLYVL